MTTKAQLRAALKWALEGGYLAVSYDHGFRDSGCGCCSSTDEPPAHLDAVLREVRREILAEQAEADAARRAAVKQKEGRS